VEDGAVAERDGVGQGLEAHPVLREPGYGQHPRDGAEGQDEVVVAHHLVAAVESGDLKLVHGRVRAGHARKPDVGPVELLT
jgi:hypothetical protein